jgi:glycine cleavage system aminomethyltransferase T
VDVLDNQVLYVTRILLSSNQSKMVLTLLKAGTAVGTQYGVAKKALLYSYKVLKSDGSGSFGWVTSAGMSYA